MSAIVLDNVASPACRNPFPGLRPFDLEDSDLFFGRDDDIQDLLSRLRRTRFLAVVGSSGCGKSSVVRAGLIASLQDGFMAEADAPWRIAIMRPGNNPIAQLAIELNKTEALGEADEQTPEHVAMLQAKLRRGALGVSEAIEEAALPTGTKVLILVDQFEELFRFAQGASARDVKPAADGDAEKSTAAGDGALSLNANDEARAFVKLLLAASETVDVPVYVVLTMRSEFLGQCAFFPGLPDAINNGLYLLPQMDREQLRDAIKEPILSCSGEISGRLLNRLLNDLGDDPDQLPILQHALMRLWALWQPERARGPMDLEHYERAGQLQGSLSKHAEEAFQELNDAQKLVAEKLFRLITDTTPDNQKVRRPMKLAQICEQAKVSMNDVVPLIEKFREEHRSFLMPPYDVPLGPETVIDISHESLIRQWGRLREWAELEVRETRLYRRLCEKAKLWEEENRDRLNLYRGVRLIEAEEWVRDHPNRLNKLEQEYLDASRKASTRRQNWLVIAICLCFAGVLGLTAWVSYQRDKAYELREEADVLRKRAVDDREVVNKLLNESNVQRQQSERAAQAYTVLFKEFGGSTEGMSAEEVSKLVSDSLDANEALGELPATDADKSRRAKTTIRMFLKNKKDEKKMDATIVEHTLMMRGFQQIEIKPSNESNVPSNSVWADLKQVNIDDAKMVALILMRAGFQIKYIGCYPDAVVRAADSIPIIRIGGKSSYVKTPAMTVEQIKNATTFPCETEPSRERVLRPPTKQRTQLLSPIFNAQPSQGVRRFANRLGVRPRP